MRQIDLGVYSPTTVTLTRGCSGSGPSDARGSRYPPATRRRRQETPYWAVRPHTSSRPTETGSLPVLIDSSSLLLPSVRTQMPARQTPHAHFGHDRDRSVFLREPLGLGHGLENGQTVRHPVASRIPVFVSDIVRPPKTIQRGHLLGSQFVGLGNAVPNDGVGRDQVQPGQLAIGEYIAPLADQVPLHGAPG